MNYKKEIEEYYSTLESKWGYTLLLGDAKHFGYYPDKISNITESEALKLHQDLIGTTLRLQSGQKVLDAGCGRGVTACYLVKKYNIKLTGIDLLGFELKIAKQKAVSGHVESQVEFMEMDYSSLEFPDNFFDAIYTSETLSHATDVQKVLCEFYRVLKPGGKIALLEYTLGEDNQFSFEDMNSLDRVIKGSAMFGLKSFRHNQFSGILTSVGFNNVVEKNITEYIRPSFERLYSKSKLFYKIINLFGLQDKFINISTPSLLLPLVNKDLVRYCIFSAEK